MSPSPPIRYLLSLFLLSLGASRANAEEQTWREAPPKVVAVGDLVFRHGQGTWTSYFINASRREKRFSHVGIVVRTGNGTADILHSDADDSTGIGCVRIQDWKGFYANTLECAVFRYSGLDAATVIPRIVSKGLEKLGVPFDPSFDLATEDRLYCTEFIRYAVNSATGRSLINPVRVNDAVFIPLDEIYKVDFTRVYDSATPSDTPLHPVSDNITKP